MNWMTWVLFVGLLWISPGTSKNCKKDSACQRLRNCFFKENTHLIVADNFNGVINTWAEQGWGVHCIVFLDKNRKDGESFHKNWPQIKTNVMGELLLIEKWHINRKLHLYILSGKKCNTTVSNLTDCLNRHLIGSTETGCCDSISDTGSCQIRFLNTETICKSSTYDEKHCRDNSSTDNKNYDINITTANVRCLNCDNPVKKAEVTLDKETLENILNLTTEIEEGEEVDAAQAVEVMSKMSDLASSINGSSAALDMGGGVTGVLVRETTVEDVKEVSFGYGSPRDSINIVDDKNSLAPFTRSVTVPEEAFKTAVSLNIRVPFAALFRFTNMSKDENNSTVLGNEVLAVEMGTNITNLTDKISINFRKVKYEGTPSCHSWNGEGSRPNWTDDGCQTIQEGDNITCQCSHLTFFAILMTPPNETISDSDLNNLTVITQAGCGLSMFFLCIVLFMHFLLRKTKASKATRILIHLVFALLLLNFTFLINNFVASLESSVGCKIMAALMHYFMLVTFTLFAVQAFHLCLQLHMGGKVEIPHYMLKVSVISWTLPSVFGVVLLSTGKYGQQTITTDAQTVSMCWITDNNVHYIVNIGYYVLVFLFTFATFIITMSLLFHLKRTKAGDAKSSKSGKSIVTIMGLCCMLGITWGFAFFAYGVFRIPALYLFTVLNSFQGFFLFIYYYKTSHSGETSGGENPNSSTSTSTLKTKVDNCENPYYNQTFKPEK